MSDLQHFRTALVGFGPAGLAVLLSANRQGKLRPLLEQGLVVLEQGQSSGSGNIGQYAIDSDSTGQTFLDALQQGDEETLHVLLDTPVAQRIANQGSGAIPLRDAGMLLGQIGKAVSQIVRAYPQSSICHGWHVESAQQTDRGRWILTSRTPDGRTHSLSVDRIILATGADQPHSRLEDETIAGEPVTRWADRLVQSEELLGANGLERVAALLQGKQEPKVAVLGGSASAMAVCHALLNRVPNLTFGRHGVVLLHRRPLRPFYVSKEAAHAEGFFDFTDNDLCQLTQRVYRLAGLRLDSRELLLRLLGVGGRPPEERMRMHQLQASDPQAIQVIDNADLVIAAFGYRPRGLTLLASDGRRIATFAETGASRPLVDQECRVMDATGTPVRGVFGIGLAAGFVPRGRLGGEPSFVGQANGLWLWQTDVGAIIVDQVLERVSPQKQSSPDKQVHLCQVGA